MRDNTTYANEHALSTDCVASVGSSVPTAVMPAALLEWRIGPSRAWTGTLIASCPNWKVGHSLLSQAAMSIRAGTTAALHA